MYLIIFTAYVAYISVYLLNYIYSLFLDLTTFQFNSLPYIRLDEKKTCISLEKWLLTFIFCHKFLTTVGNYFKNAFCIKTNIIESGLFLLRHILAIKYLSYSSFLLNQNNVT